MSPIDFDRNRVGFLLPVEGRPNPCRVNGLGVGASRNGYPYVRLQVSRLVVNIYDRAALNAWTQAWATVERTAARIWPACDAFSTASAT